MNAKTRERMRKLAEDMLSPERRAAAEQRVRNDRFAAIIWLQNHELTLRGEDIVDLDARLSTDGYKESVRGGTYFFDVLLNGQRVGHGYVCWHAGHERPFRQLDWHLTFADGTETYELGEEVWRRARLDRQLPRQFRKGYRSHSKAVLDALSATDEEEVDATSPWRPKSDREEAVHRLLG